MMMDWETFKRQIAITLTVTSLFFVAACANNSKNNTQPLIEVFTESRQLQDEVKHKEVQKAVKELNKDDRIFTHLDDDRLVIMRYILTEINKRNMPAEIAMMPLIESNYKPAASDRGAHVGLWQFGRATAKNFGLEVNKNYDSRYNTALSTRAALDYLEYLNKMFDGDWLLTMAAYNAGEGRVLKSIKANKARGKKTDYWNIDLPPITRKYIPQILALSEVISKKQSVIEITQDEIPDLVRIRMDTPEMLRKVIATSDVPMEVIQFYNPNIAKKNSGVRGIVIPASELEKIKGIPKNKFNQYIIYSHGISKNAK